MRAEPNRTRDGSRCGPVRRLLAFLAAAVAALPAIAAAQPGADSLDTHELARRIDLLSQSLDDLRLGDVAGPPASAYGFGPAASKVYGVDRGVSFGGYGEMLYENFAATRQNDTPSGKLDAVDFLRQIVYFGFKYDDRFLFNSEIEFEHASTGKSGSVSVEFAYIDALLRPEVNARAGMLLVPMGFVNELHEPPVFLGARRPETESKLVPSTWRANGAGFFGDPAPGLSYRAYVVEGLRSVKNDKAKIGGFGAAGLRDGRQSASSSRAEDLAAVLRADYETHGVLAGGSVFHGATAQGDTVGGRSFDAATTIYEAHVQLRRFGVRLRALLAGATVRQAEKINAANGLTGSNSVGSELLGWYVEGGYEVMRRLVPASAHEIVPYVRFEKLNTQAEVPAGFTANPANDQTILTLGAAFYPHPQIVVKSDWQKVENEATTGTDQWNVALGYLF